MGDVFAITMSATSTIHHQGKCLAEVSLLINFTIGTDTLHMHNVQSLPFSLSLISSRPTSQSVIYRITFVSYPAA